MKCILNLLIVISFLGLTYPVLYASDTFLSGGYVVPVIKPLSPTSQGQLRFGDLNIVGRGRVRYLINLDRSPMRWADELLNFRVGFSQHWSPGSIYALFPEGYEHDPERASVFLSSLKLKFRHPFAVESDEVVRAVNQPLYTMYRQEGWIVVSKGDERRWYFESIDGGLSWRLGQLEFIKHPGMFTRLQYEGDKVVTIVFPNGQEAAIEYEGDLPRKIQTPFGQTVTIAYGAGGYISQIDVVSLPGEDGPRASKETKTYKFTCNANGQITEMITPEGEAYTCEYQTSNSVEAGVKKRVDQTTVRRKRDGLFSTRIDEFRVDREWVVKILRGGSKDDLSTACLNAPGWFTEVERGIKDGIQEYQSQRPAQSKRIKGNLFEVEQQIANLINAMSHMKSGSESLVKKLEDLEQQKRHLSLDLQQIPQELDTITMPESDTVQAWFKQLPELLAMPSSETRECLKSIFPEMLAEEVIPGVKFGEVRVRVRLDPYQVIGQASGTQWRKQIASVLPTGLTDSNSDGHWSEFLVVRPTKWRKYGAQIEKMRQEGVTWPELEKHFGKTAGSLYSILTDYRRHQANSN